MVTSTDFHEVHVGQLWRERYRKRSRLVEVVSVTAHVNDPISLGERVRVRNVHTGRYSHMLASTLRDRFKYEREAADEQQ